MKILPYALSMIRFSRPLFCYYATERWYGTLDLKVSKPWKYAGHGLMRQAHKLTSGLNSVFYVYMWMCIYAFNVYKDL